MEANKVAATITMVNIPPRRPRLGFADAELLTFAGIHEEMLVSGP